MFFLRLTCCLRSTEIARLDPLAQSAIRSIAEASVAYLNEFGEIFCVSDAQIFDKVEAVFENGVYSASPNQLDL